MSGRRLADTNLIVRYLAQDHEKHARTAAKLFEACDRGELVLVLLPEVLAECVFVLESFYKHARKDIASALRVLASSPGIEIDGRAIHLEALDRYRATRAHFVDCVIASVASAGNFPVATFDKGFRKFAGVRVNVD